jgi:hypothetical protein
LHIEIMSINRSGRDSLVKAERKQQERGEIVKERSRGVRIELDRCFFVVQSQAADEYKITSDKN